MGRNRDETDRVIGPTFIPSRKGASKWRVILLSPKAANPSRRRVTRWFATEADGQEVCDQVDEGIAYKNSCTIGSVIDEYEQHLASAGTIGHHETIRRLRLFFPRKHIQIARVSPEDAEEMYESFRSRVKSNGEPISVSYHRSALINARSLFKWARKRGLIPANPFAEVEGVGKKRRGKQQWTGDEARRFYLFALARARAGDKAALGSLMLLLMALRSSDVTKRIVRDVDLGGSVLRVYEGKTDKTNRTRHIPRVLRPMLAKLTKGREAFRPLFQTPYRPDGHHTRRWLEQALDKLAKAAGVPRVVPHSLKGVSGSVLAETGESSERVADHLSHESEAVTRAHYVQGDALDTARMNRGIRAISSIKTSIRRPKKKRRK
jgi:integrase